ncbi:MAG: fumarylacetoacetase, partial [Acidimicrobiia bacterium]
MVTDFPVPALPYCVFSDDTGRRRIGVGVGSEVADLSALSPGLASVPTRLVEADRLNPLLAEGRSTWSALREELVGLAESGRLDAACLPRNEVALHLAWDVADFVDFYSSRHHAENVGRIFRPESDPLPANWLHLPAGYHGRASTVVVDGTAIRRPTGQVRTDDGRVVHRPTDRLDFELELGFVVGGGTDLGVPVAIEDAADHLFGLVLMNDWTARDVQAWEYVPLGPFLGKSFATSVSAWVMPLDALEGARVPGPVQNPPPLPHLQRAAPWSLALELEVWIRPAGSPDAHRVCAVETGDALYWDAAQQLAHLTSNGARLSAGDLFGSGTVSDLGAGQYGCLLEATWGGSRTIAVGDETRVFLEDGDEVTMRGGL